MPDTWVLGRFWFLDRGTPDVEYLDALDVGRVHTPNDAPSLWAPNSEYLSSYYLPFTR